MTDRSTMQVASNDVESPAQARQYKHNRYDVRSPQENKSGTATTGGPKSANAGSSNDGLVIEQRDDAHDVGGNGKENLEDTGTTSGGQPPSNRARNRSYASKSNGRYCFEGREPSGRSVDIRSVASLETFHSEDYEDMASKRSRRSERTSTTAGSASSYTDDDNDDDDSEADDDDDDDALTTLTGQSLISRTMDKLPKVSGKETILRKKHSNACKYLRDGKYDKSLKLFEEILGGLVERYGKEHHRVGTAMHNIGIVQLRAGNLDHAYDAMKVAVRTREDAHGKDHPKVADSLVELGIILLSRREFEESLFTFNDALTSREARVEKNPDDRKLNLQVAKVLNNIGCVYFEYGELENSRLTFEEALEIQQQYLGEEDPVFEPGVLSMASTMCNIAYVHIEKANYVPAIEMLEQALQIQEAVLEDDNKLVLNTLDNLGYAYTMDGSYDDALRNYAEILDTRKIVSGPKTLEYACTLKKMCYIYMKQCRFETALSKLLDVRAVEHARLESADRRSRETKRMINAVNYQLLKFPSIWEAFFTGLKRKGAFKNLITQRYMEMACLGTSEQEIDMDGIKIPKPQNSSKMAGHKVAYA